ncbi:unnamed protein product [Ambrosiozyma monospora]|uniref:Unnamed protein product n=1 Tax=Ambrosiozyma monospora TaxID=43982 RepID=A0ACB5SYK1_AMBMO|nr:unnamed protein product [Ambrosiozyma monospora]
MHNFPPISGDQQQHRQYQQHQHGRSHEHGDGQMLDENNTENNNSDNIPMSNGGDLSSHSGSGSSSFSGTPSASTNIPHEKSKNGRNKSAKTNKTKNNTKSQESVPGNDSVKSGPTSVTGTSSKSNKTGLKFPKMKKVCSACHQRKVKCDLFETPNTKDTCSACKQLGYDCVIYIRKKRVVSKATTNNSTILTGGVDHTNAKNGSSSSDAGRNGQSANGKLTTGGNIPTRIPSYIDTLNVSECQLDVIQLDPEFIIKEGQKQVLKFKRFYGHLNSSPLRTALMNKFHSQISGRPYSRLDELDYQTLMLANCFTLPSQEVCWKFINLFFEFNNWNLIVNKKKFMQDYRDLTKPPSILLLQSVLLMGCKLYGNKLTDKQERKKNENTAKLLHKKATLLYNLGFDDFEPIPMVQSLIIFCLAGAQIDHKGPTYYSNLAVSRAYEYDFVLFFVCS